MDDQVILAEEKDQILTLTLNRPQAMNAFNYAQVEALQAHIDAVRFRPEIRVVILTGAGEKAFCAGADLKERATLSELRVNEYLYKQRNLFTSIEDLNKPVIAAINGAAFGGGTEITLACDIRIISETASMGLTETRLAIIPGAGGTQRLPRLIGRGKAKELIYTGRRISAREALDIGLVNKVCKPDALLEECRKMAAEMCLAGPLALEQAKKAINCGMDTDLHTGIAIETDAYKVLIPTEDRIEGLAAFREKRKPDYKGK
jgi:enoyl-CoA hydratase/carnithine racemase